MPMLRRCGGRVSMRLPPMRISPAFSSVKPAIMRSSVVLPQPEGPSSVKNSLSSISSEMLRTAVTDPKDRLTPSIVIIFHREPQDSAGFLDDIFDLVERGRSYCRPCRLVVRQDLEARKRRHVAGEVGEVQVLTRRAAESPLDDHLAHILAIDVVDKGLSGVQVRSALDDRHAFHLPDCPVGGIDG